MSIKDYYGLVMTVICATSLMVLSVNSGLVNKKLADINAAENVFAKMEAMSVDATAYLCVDKKERRLHGIVKNGEKCEPGWSAATDPANIPLGSLIYIPDMKRWFIAHDTGNLIKGNRIDLAVETREQAEQFGKQNMDIIIVRF